MSNCIQPPLIGSAIGANVFLKICAYSTAQVSKLKNQLIEEFGEIPKECLKNVMKGSSAIGFWSNL